MALGVSAWGRASQLIREGNILLPTVARASGTTSLLDGVTRLTNNIPASINRMVAGISIPFYRVMPACTNLVSAQTTSTGLTSNVLNGIARTLTEDSSTGTHGADTVTAATLAAATGYWIGVAARRVSGSRNLEVVANDGVNAAGISIDLGTGVATAITVGGGSVTLITSALLPSGDYLVRARISSTAWTAAAVSVRTGLLSGATNSYTGAGSASVVVTGVTLTVNVIATHLLPEGATDLADDIQSQAISLPTTGTIFAPFMSYASDWAAGATTHGYAARIFSHAADVNQITRQFTDDAVRRDTVNQGAPINPSLAVVDRVLQTRALTWDAAAVQQHRNASLNASDTTLAGPYETSSSVVRLGNRTDLIRALHGIQPMPLIFSRVLTSNNIATLHSAYSVAGNFVGSAF